ncbi:uncharacterized protein LOC103167717 [Ornithorhynchus anatinus]|uniref:ZP domain-containing protein n=1 Tax=Ornithorhynchus anatinus TaxID=9258 RepID=F6W6B5_ORNAN|nr:uncharacterized protein LOC103167717 [Ornithorhynchus anatinus]
MVLLRNMSCGLLLFLLLPWFGLGRTPPTHVFPPGIVASHCLSRIFWMKLDQRFLKGKVFTLELVDPHGGVPVPLDAKLASRCGYILSEDVWGNPVFRASVLGCHVTNQGDTWFSLGVNVKVSSAVDERRMTTYSHMMYCTYASWAPREILCEENYMEVSVKSDVPTISEGKDPEQWMSAHWMSALPGAQEAAYKIWQMMFHSPSGRNIILVSNAAKLGYGFNNTGARVFLRTPYFSNESEITMIENLPVATVSSTAVYKQRWLLLLIDTTVSCPVDGVLFSNTTITWSVPSILPPLILQLGTFRSENVSMGVGGRRVTDPEALSYSLQMNTTHIEVTVPIGAEGGRIKSDVVNGVYGTTYSINLFLEHVWTDTDWHLTKYIVIKPITTPFTARVPTVINNTIPDTRLFNIVIGSFLPDDQLVKVEIGNVPYTIQEAKSHGYKISETLFPNGTKGFVLEVPFDDSNVIKEYVNRNETKYTLLVNYTLKVGPERKSFHQPAEIECTLEDIIVPQAVGSCDEENMYLTLPTTGLRQYWDLYIGNELLILRSGLSHGYFLMENATHLLLKVPLFAKGVTYEDISLQGIQARLDVALRKANTMETLNIFSVQCNYHPSDFIVCFPNGTVAASALMLTDPSIDLGKTTLKDRSCKPREFTKDRAYFRFHVASCGTSLRFEGDYMVYENEISLERETLPVGGHPTITRDPAYRLTLLCYYLAKETLVKKASIRSKSRNSAPLPYGDGTVVLPSTFRGSRRTRQTLEIQSRISKDHTFTEFYNDKNRMVMKQWFEPMYFEIELLHYEDTNAELFLDKCWISQSPEFDGHPQWSIVEKSCEKETKSSLAQLFPVIKNKRVQNPSLVKRLMVRRLMPGSERVYLHCLTLICSSLTGPKNPASCGRQCPSVGEDTLDILTELHSRHHGYTAAGPILLTHSNGKDTVNANQETTIQMSGLWVAVGIITSMTVAVVILHQMTCIQFKKCNNLQK